MHQTLERSEKLHWVAHRWRIAYILVLLKTPSAVNYEILC